jgi:hypothetical protein
MSENQQFGVQHPVETEDAPAPATVAGAHWADGKLTRAGMEQAIKDGGSVMYKGKILTSLDQLPSEADLAAGDSQRESQARENLLKQKDAIDKELAKIGKAKK